MHRSAGPILLTLIVVTGCKDITPESWPNEVPDNTFLTRSFAIYVVMLTIIGIRVGFESDEYEGGVVSSTLSCLVGGPVLTFFASCLILFLAACATYGVLGEAIVLRLDFVFFVLMWLVMAFVFGMTAIQIGMLLFSQDHEETRMTFAQITVGVLATLFSGFGVVIGIMFIAKLCYDLF